MIDWLADDIFGQGVASLPLVSIDLLVKDAVSERYLLGWRCNRPAADHWFVPGGRVRKNERLDDAFSRLSEFELGVDLHRSAAQWRGVYQHFYDDYVFGEGVSTHYIVLAYEVIVDLSRLVLPTEQHSKYRWMTREEITESTLVHQYSKDYFQ
tara:strand:+ start:14079 stop:14537 length:459 start_codon:yes stop_codon:yes gene_type:complete